MEFYQTYTAKYPPNPLEIKIFYYDASPNLICDEILALTFTDKAAGEMEERVDKLLPMGYVDLWISTFHSFAQKLLKDHALEIGIPNDFKLLNQTQQWLLVRQNLDKFNLDHYKPLGNPTKFIHALIKLFSRAKDEVVG
ncbi:MAG: UvrD-helicase domain-containing protein, partial [Bacteroidetes bacterium]|nr:UvrD-helicase domain-containing protein [Bacteroidota bacterium]